MEKIFVLICQVGRAITVYGVSTDKDKLAKVLKEEVYNHLEGVYGPRKELEQDPEEYNFELSMYESVDNLSNPYFWSDEDDELPVVFYITESEIIK